MAFKQENIITASIVTYKTNVQQLKNLICLLKQSSTRIQLFVIDNSPEPDLKRVCEGIRYFHNPSNSGFGAGHNLALKFSFEMGSKYHFVVNPDIWFETDVISPIVSFLDNEEDIGMVMPRVLHGDGTIQYLPKLLPNPFWIARRKLKAIDPNSTSFLNKYELRQLSEVYYTNVPILSGCFTVMRVKALQEVGIYDERYFMYFEDFDLSRRMHQKYRTVYFPQVFIYHAYESGANKSWKLFKVFIQSMIVYFNKWGWFFDKERRNTNLKALQKK